MFRVRLIMSFGAVSAIDKGMVMDRLLIVDRALSAVQLSFGRNITVCNVSSPGVAVCDNHLAWAISNRQVFAHHKNTDSICRLNSCDRVIADVDLPFLTNLDPFASAGPEEFERSFSSMKDIIDKRIKLVADTLPSTASKALANQLTWDSNDSSLCTRLQSFRAMPQRVGAHWVTFKKLYRDDAVGLAMEIAERLVQFEVVSMLAIADEYCGSDSSWYEDSWLDFSEVFGIFSSTNQCTRRFWTELGDYIDEGSSDSPAPEIDSCLTTESGSLPFYKAANITSKLVDGVVLSTHPTPLQLEQHRSTDPAAFLTIDYPVNQLFSLKAWSLSFDVKVNSELSSDVGETFILGVVPHFYIALRGNGQLMVYAGTTVNTVMFPWEVDRVYSIKLLSAADEALFVFVDNVYIDLVFIGDKNEMRLCKPELQVGSNTTSDVDVSVSAIYFYETLAYPPQLVSLASSQSPLRQALNATNEDSAVTPADEVSNEAVTVTESTEYASEASFSASTEHTTSASILPAKEELSGLRPVSSRDHPSYAWLLVVPIGIFVFLSICLGMTIKCLLKSRASLIDNELTLTGTVSPDEDLEAAHPPCHQIRELDMTDYKELCAILRIRHSASQQLLEMTDVCKAQ